MLFDPLSEVYQQSRKVNIISRHGTEGITLKVYLSCAFGAQWEPFLLMLRAREIADCSAFFMELVISYLKNVFSYITCPSLIDTLSRNEKPFSCSICGGRFSRYSSLWSHKKLHSGEKNYKCGVCGIAFAKAVYLKNHTRIHTGEKPYK